MPDMVLKKLMFTLLGFSLTLVQYLLVTPLFLSRLFCAIEYCKVQLSLILQGLTKKKEIYILLATLFYLVLTEVL